MSLTKSTMLALGSKAPLFSLRSTKGEVVSLADFNQEPILVVMFICNHCPYVIHIAQSLKNISDEYRERGVAFVAINSNDAKSYPADSFENMKMEVDRRAYQFPYLFDEAQEVAKAFGAACTPDLYVFDSSRRLTYRGQFDDTRPTRISSGNYDSMHSPATGSSLIQILEKMLDGKQISEKQVPSMGCNIKWKPGNEPSYYG